MEVIYTYMRIYRGRGVGLGEGGDLKQSGVNGS